MAIVDTPTELSDEVLKSVEKGQRSAIESVHKFVDPVDEKLPALGDEHPSMRQELIGVALDMADRLVHTSTSSYARSCRVWPFTWTVRPSKKGRQPTSSVVAPQTLSLRMDPPSSLHPASRYPPSLNSEIPCRESS
jgi:hypothetical protein